MKMLIGAPLLAAFMAVTLSGCGGSDEDSAKAAAEGFYSAAARGDGTEACKYLSDDLKITGDRDCAKLIEGRLTVSEYLEDGRIDRIKRASFVKDVRVTGDTASVLLGDGKSTAELEKVDGHWLITVDPLDAS